MLLMLPGAQIISLVWLMTVTLGEPTSVLSMSAMYSKTKSMLLASELDEGHETLARLQTTPEACEPTELAAEHDEGHETCAALQTTPEASEPIELAAAHDSGTWVL